MYGSRYGYEEGYITLDEGQVARVRDLVDSGRATSVSGFVQHEVGVALDDVAGWGPPLAGALEQSGGALKPEERDWADGILKTDKGRLPAA